MTRLATHRVYRNAAGDYCSVDDPTVAFLVCGVGGTLPDDYPTEDVKPSVEPEKVEPAEPEKVEGVPTPKRKKA